MRSHPAGRQLLEAVSALFRAADPPSRFLRLVAANAIDIARREAELGPTADAAAQARLRALLGHDGTAAELEHDLAMRLSTGDVTPETPGLIDHLWASALEEIAIDQPQYATSVPIVSKQFVPDGTI